MSPNATTSGSNNYERIYRDFETIRKDSKMTECDKLDELKRLQIDLKQLYATYWTKPCFKNWPCPFNVEYHPIEDLQEKMAVVITSFIRRCETETFIQRTAGENKTVNISDRPQVRMFY